MCERVMLHGETSHHWEHEKDTPWFVTITLIYIVQQFHSISKPVLSAYCKPGTLDTEARAWKRPAICPRGAYIAVRGTEKAVGRTDCYKDIQNGKQNTTFESGKGNTENYSRGHHKRSDHPRIFQEERSFVGWRGSAFHRKRWGYTGLEMKKFSGSLKWWVVWSGHPFRDHRACTSLVVQMVINLCERPGFNPWIRKIPWRQMATHSSILAWRIPWHKSLVGYSP